MGKPRLPRRVPQASNPPNTYEGAGARSRLDSRTPDQPQPTTDDDVIHVPVPPNEPPPEVIRPRRGWSS